MEKLSSFFIGVVDFFAALLPGAATVVVLLGLAPQAWLEPAAPLFAHDEAAVIAFIAAAYIVGQAMNATGSYMLDIVYDAFYAPKHGLLVGKSKANGGNRWQQLIAKVDDWDFPFGAFLSGLVESETGARHDRLEQDLDKLGKSEAGGPYGRIRAYCLLAMPAAFEQIERLESEQKFFRTTTIATLLIATIATLQGHSVWWLWPSAAFLFTRYVSRRRKTVERAYMFFGLRAVSAGTASPSSPSR